VVIDRIKDLAETSRGERFSPQYIENQAEILALYRRDGGVGRRPDTLAAMICIRFSIISNGEKNRISFTTYTDLARGRKCTRCCARVETVNATLRRRNASQIPAALQELDRR